MQFDGFDWDEGNWPKCGRHGVGKDEIEAVLSDPLTRIFPDPLHSGVEIREFAVGRSVTSAHAMVVIFTRRTVEGSVLLRPVSARYMHDKEFAKYEQTRN